MHQKTFEGMNVSQMVGIAPCPQSLSAQLLPIDPINRNSLVDLEGGG